MFAIEKMPEDHLIASNRFSV